MSPNEVLQIAGSELDLLSQQLIGRHPTTAQAVATIESLTNRFTAIRQDLPSLNAPELQASLRAIQTKAKRLQALLEAGTLFHCHCIFGRTETPDTYGSDGKFSASQDSRIVFQG
jgi:hypothetical protein